jgi:hypothetical protein
MSRDFGTRLYQGLQNEWRKFDGAGDRGRTGDVQLRGMKSRILRRFRPSANMGIRRPAGDENNRRIANPAVLENLPEEL